MFIGTVEIVETYQMVVAKNYKTYTYRITEKNRSYLNFIVIAFLFLKTIHMNTKSPRKAPVIIEVVGSYLNYEKFWFSVC